MTQAVPIGTAIVAYIEPHAGLAREFNAWYERDHFPATVTGGPGVFAGARFVATGACKAVRPRASLFGGEARGSYLALAWVHDGMQDDWDTWVGRQMERLVAARRMFPGRDHLHTAVYRFAGEESVASGPPAALALDRCFAGAVAVAVERLDGAAPDDSALAGVREWMGTLVAPALPVAVALTRERLVASVLPPEEAGREHVLVVGFVDGDVLATWADHVAPSLPRLDDHGLRAGFASPFLRTVPGSDTYTDDL